MTLHAPRILTRRSDLKGEWRTGVREAQAERRELASNLLLWMPLGLQGFSDRLDM
jgi:hypothetical protein